MEINTTIQSEGISIIPEKVTIIDIEGKISETINNELSELEFRYYEKKEDFNLICSVFEYEFIVSGDCFQIWEDGEVIVNQVEIDSIELFYEGGGVEFKIVDVNNKQFISNCLEGVNFSK